MNEENKKLKEFHGYLEKDNYPVPDYETFASTLEDPKKAQDFYDALVKDGYAGVAPDFDTFSMTLGLKKKDLYKELGLGRDLVSEVFGTRSSEGKTEPTEPVSKKPEEGSLPVLADEIDFGKFKTPDFSLRTPEFGNFVKGFSDNIIADITREGIDKERFNQHAKERIQEINKELSGLTENAPKITGGAPPYAIYSTDASSEGSKKRESLLQEKNELEAAVKDPSKADYFFGKIASNSIVGLASQIYAEGITKGSRPKELDQEWLSKHNAGLMTDVAATTIGFLLDGPLFSGLGSLGASAGKKAIQPLVKNLANKTVDKFIKAGFEKSVAEKLAQRGLGRLSWTIPAMTSSGTALGGYGSLNEGLTQWADPDKDFKDIEFGQVLSRGMKDFSLGVGVGTLGLGTAALSVQAQRIPQAALRIGSQAGIQAGGLTAESALFIGGGALLDGRALKDITKEEFIETAALLGTLKVSHAIQKPKEIAVNIYRSSKFNPNRPGEGMYEVEISPWEMDLIGGKDYKSIMKEYSGNPEKLGDILKNDNIPAHLKQRLLWGAQGVGMENVNLVADNVKTNGEFVDLYNKEGVLVDRRKFSDKDFANQAAIEIGLQLEDNKMQAHSASDQVDRVKLLNDYKNKGGDLQKLLTALDKPVMERSPEESKLVGDWFSMIPKPKEGESKQSAEEKPGEGNPQDQIAKDLGLNFIGRQDYGEGNVFDAYDYTTPNGNVSMMVVPEGSPIEVVKAKKAEFDKQYQEQSKPGATKKKKPIYKEGSRTSKAMNQVANDFEDAVMQFFIGGGKINRQDFIDNSGWGEADIKKSGLGFLLSKSGAKMDVFNEKLENSFGMENKGPMDMINAIVEVLKANPTRSKMLEAFEKRRNINDPYEPTAEEIAIREKDDKWNEIVTRNGGYNEKAIEELANEGLLSKDQFETYKKALEDENAERDKAEREWRDEEARIIEQTAELERGNQEVPPSGEKSTGDVKREGEVKDEIQKPDLTEGKKPEDQLPRSTSPAEGGATEKGKTESSGEKITAVKFYDALKKNNAPRIQIQDEFGGERVTWSADKSDFMDVSDETGRKIRWGVELSDGRTVSLDGLIRITQPEVWARWASKIKGMKLENKNEFIIKQTLGEKEFDQMYNETIDFLEKEDVYSQTYRGRDEKTGEKRYTTDVDPIKVNKLLKEEGHPLAGIFSRDIRLNDKSEVNAYQRWIWEIDQNKRKIGGKFPERKSVSEMTDAELEKESSDYDIIIKEREANLEKGNIPITGSNTGVGTLTQPEFDRYTSINDELQRRNSISSSEAKERVAAKRAERLAQKQYTPEQQSKIDAINKEYDARIAEVESIIPEIEKEMRAALKKADKRNGLFGDMKPVDPDEIFKREEQGFQFNEETVANIRQPFEGRIVEKRKEIANLKIEQKRAIRKIDEEKQQREMSFGDMPKAEIATTNKVQRDKLNDFISKLDIKGGTYIGTEQSSAGLIVNYKLPGDKSARQATIFKDGQMMPGKSGMPTEGELKPPNFKDQDYFSTDQVQEAFDSGKLTTEEFKPLYEKAAKFEERLRKQAADASGKIDSRIDNLANDIEAKIQKEINDKKGTLSVKLFPDFISQANTSLYKQLVKIRDSMNDILAKQLQKGVISKNAALRWNAKVITNLYNGLLRSQADIHGKDFTVIGDVFNPKSTQERKIGKLEMTGTVKSYAEYKAKNLIDAWRGLVGNDPVALERVWSVLDPELANYKSEEGVLTESQEPRPLVYGDLSLAEKNLYWALKEWNTWQHNTNYANGLISTETYLKFKGDYDVTGYVDYIPRMYDVFEADPLVSPEIQEFINRGNSAVTGRMNADYFKAREESNEWKKTHAIKDPAYLTAKRVMQTIQNVAIKQYMDLVIAEHPEYVKTVKPNAEVPAGYTKLSNSYSWGPFRGKAVANHIVEDFTGYFYASNLANTAYDAIKMWDRTKVNQFYKKYRTVYNPFVQIGNVTGNVFFASVNGINPALFVKGMIDNRNIREKDPAMYEALLKSGLIGDTAITGEMKPIDTLNPDQTALGKVDEFATKLYVGADNLAKISAYKIFRGQGLSHQQAVRRAYDAFQNYTTVGKTWDVASKIPLVGPTYVKFQADLQRILLNSMTTTPLTTIGTFMMIKLFGNLASALSGETEEEQEIRESRKGVPRVPILDIPLSFKVGKSEINVARYLTPLYIYPQGDSEMDIAELSKFMPIQVQKKEQDALFPMPAFADASWGWLGSVLTDRDFRMMSIQDPYSTRYTNPNITTGERIKNVLDFSARSQLPFYKGSQDIYKGATGQLDYYGRRRNWYQAILNNIVKIQQFDKPEMKSYIERNLGYLTSRYASLATRMGDANAELFKAIKYAQDKGLSEDVIEKLYEKESKKRDKRLQKSLDEQIPVLQEIERLTNTYKNWYPEDPFVQENYQNIQAGKNQRFNVLDDVDFQKKYKDEYLLLKSNGMLKRPEVPSYLNGYALTEEQRKKYVSDYWSEYIRQIDSLVGLTQEEFDEEKENIVSREQSTTTPGPKETSLLQAKATAAAAAARGIADMYLRSNIK